MNRKLLAALMRNEIEVYVAAMRYVNAAAVDVGLHREPTDLQPAYALLAADPEVLTLDYSTPEMVRATMAAVARMLALLLVLWSIRLLYPWAKRAFRRIRHQWVKPTDDDVAMLIPWLVIAITSIILIRMT